VENGRTQVGINPTRGVTAKYPVSPRDEQVRAVLREGTRDETAMKKRLDGILLDLLTSYVSFLELQ